MATSFLSPDVMRVPTMGTDFCPHTVHMVVPVLTALVKSIKLHFSVILAVKQHCLNSEKYCPFLMFPGPYSEQEETVALGVESRFPMGQSLTTSLHHTH